jgi:hypothetical protein
MFGNFPTYSTISYVLESQRVCGIDHHHELFRSSCNVALQLIALLKYLQVDLIQSMVTSLCVFLLMKAIIVKRVYSHCPR